jgi:hypothetical protein
MAALIFENQYLIPKFARRNYAEMNHFLVVATDLEKALEAKDKIEIEFEKVRN